MTEVTVGGTVVATYTYDALDRRIGIDDNGTQTWTVYDGMSADAHPYADFTGGASLAVRYLSGPGVVNGRCPWTSSWRGRARADRPPGISPTSSARCDIVSSAGTELDHIVYDSFGNILSETHSNNGDRFKFAGMEYDATTGQYYDRARGYSSIAGRFTAQDPAGFAAGLMNLYSYVGGGPTNDVDFTGKADPG